MKFPKINLLILSLVFIFLLQGCQKNMESQTKHKMMREELLEFAQGNHPKTENPDEQVTQIVKKYIQVGISIPKAAEIANKNGIEIKKAYRTGFEIKENVDFYVGSIDRIPMPLSPLNYKEVRIILVTKHDQNIISDVKVHLFVFGL
jgi:hypothetical protein